MQVLTWNLFHGRSPDGAGRELLGEFAAALAGWPWDVALLQEVPPWWPVPLARASGASMRMALTARNEPAFLRRWAARRWPDLLKSWGGGSNAILVRGGRIAAHRRKRLRRVPERRVVHAVDLQDRGWVANVHAQVRPHGLTRADVAAAAAALARWSAGAPAAVLGGDLNLPDPEVPGMVRAGGHGVDHVFVRGWAPAASRVLDAGPLSDHRPVLVSLSATSSRSRAAP